ncbi:MAG: type I methionyl aminopeptidase [Acidobacteria bacterium]|nr:MAG: type I methionyl aminopeptidase [Acidobacteriota bacterium]
MQKLLDVTRESLDRAIDKMRAGNRLGDVGHAVQSWVEQHGYSVVREFVGHGIGTKMHDEPNLPNYGDEGHGARLQEGMVIAVEPMVNAGRPEVRMREMQKLLDVTRESLDRAIDKMRAGNRLGDVGHAVQSWVEQHGYSVVREFVGHGIGTKMHDEPNLPNYGDEGHGARLQEGMVIAVEPMVNAGRPEVRMRDEWVAETADGSPSAHFEHTVAITANGPWILTRPKEMTGPSW